MKNVLIYDAADESPVGKSWRVGARVFGPLFDIVLPVKSVEEMRIAIRTELGDTDDDEHVKAQVWGHGMHGAPLIDGDVIEPTIPSLAYIDEIWFRSCYVAGGKSGHDFVAALNARGIDVVAHTCLIGSWGMQSGLVGARASDGVWWDESAWPQRSAPWRPRTVSALRMSVTSWAWGPK